MQKPTPDGYLVLTFREPVVLREPNPLPEDFVVKHNFKNVESINTNRPQGVFIKFKDHFVCYPWDGIQEWYHQYNSDKYVAQLKEYQETHDHNWISTEELNHEGQLVWFCEDKDDGDQGCEKIKTTRPDWEVEETSVLNPSPHHPYGNPGPGAYL